MFEALLTGLSSCGGEYFMDYASLSWWSQGRLLVLEGLCSYPRMHLTHPLF